MTYFTLFMTFLKLGCTSFGGPAAHLGYFQKVFVEQKRWLKPDEYAQLIAFSQFLPGPSSSQVGFAIGYERAGIGGALAAFFGFTLPSFILLYLLAVIPSDTNPYLQAATLGLKLFAVVIVLDAVISMAKSFCTKQLTAIACLSSATLVLLAPYIYTQLIIIIGAAIVGLIISKKEHSSTIKIKRPKVIPAFIFLLAVLIAIFAQGDIANTFSAFFYAGSLVFGGGHVVLSLLQSMLPNFNQDQFLLGYAAAQSVPGPMFTLATYLGAVAHPANPLLFATIATFAIFLPGFLLLLTFKDSWKALANHSQISQALALINASVVGFLLAALYQPIFTSSVHQASDLAVVLIGFICLRFLKMKILFLVLAFVTLGVLLH